MNCYRKVIDASLEATESGVEVSKGLFQELGLVSESDEVSMDAAEKIIRSFMSPEYPLESENSVKAYFDEFLRATRTPENVRVLIRKWQQEYSEVYKMIFEVTSPLQKYTTNVVEKCCTLMISLERAAEVINDQSQGPIDHSAKLVPVGMAAYADAKDKVKLGTRDIFVEAAVIFRNNRTGQTELMTVDNSVSAEDIKIRMLAMIERHKPFRDGEYEAIIIGGATAFDEKYLTNEYPTYKHTAKILDACASCNIPITKAQIFNAAQPTAFAVAAPKPGQQLVITKSTPGKLPEYAPAYKFLRLLNVAHPNPTQISFKGAGEFNPFIITTDMTQLWKGGISLFERAVYAKHLIELNGFFPFVAAVFLASRQHFEGFVRTANDIVIWDAVHNVIIRDCNQGVPLEKKFYDRLISKVKGKLKGITISEDGISEVKLQQLWRKFAEANYPYSIGKGSNAFNGEVAEAMAECMSWNDETKQLVVDDAQLAKNFEALSDRVNRNRIAENAQALAGGRTPQ